MFKRLCLFLSVALICLVINFSKCLFGTSFPKPVGWVNDFAGVISEVDENRLNALITDLEMKTSYEIAAVTVDTVSPLDINTYAVELYEDWGIGKRDKDNGVLVLLAMDERKVRIETGYGVEGILPDGLCGEIIRYKMVPYFKRGDFGSGVIAGVTTIASKIAEEYGVDLSQEQAPKTRYHETGVRPKPGLRSLFGGLLSLLFLIAIFGLRLGLFGFLFLPMGGYWRSGGYSGGSGGFSGGFSGFGGGLSGGGGATGSW